VTAVYDTIGRGYAGQRRADPRLAAAIRAALGDARSVVNVGAGGGSYEPPDLSVLAVEPSREMIRQRAPGAAPAVQAAAERLPLADGGVDAALAVLTLHHWTDRAAGLAELKRVARRRVVIVTWDPARKGDFWLTRDYFPAVVELDAAIFPSLAELESALGSLRVAPLPVPHDCADGFLGAYWRRPEAYLEPAARGAMSTFARVEPASLAAGLTRLADDLATGRWDARLGHLREQHDADLGYRLVVSEQTPRRDATR
jgi:SAM-dependent methyltransferase